MENFPNELVEKAELYLCRQPSAYMPTFTIFLHTKTKYYKNFPFVNMFLTGY